MCIISSEKSQKEIKDIDEPSKDAALEEEEVPEDEEGLLEHVAEYLKEMSTATHVGKAPSLLGTSVEKT